MLETPWQAKLIKEIETLFPGCMVLKNNPNYIQGIPDLIVLYQDKWACLESKRSSNASRRANQEWYIAKLASMSFASFICPDNKEEVLDELQYAFGTRRKTRVPKRQ